MGDQIRWIFPLMAAVVFIIAMLISQAMLSISSVGALTQTILCLFIGFYIMYKLWSVRGEIWKNKLKTFVKKIRKEHRDWDKEHHDGDNSTEEGGADSNRLDTLRAEIENLEGGLASTKEEQSANTQEVTDMSSEVVHLEAQLIDDGVIPPSGASLSAAGAEEPIPVGLASTPIGVEEPVPPRSLQ